MELQNSSNYFFKQRDTLFFIWNSSVLSFALLLSVFLFIHATTWAQQEMTMVVLPSEITQLGTTNINANTEFELSGVRQNNQRVSKGHVRINFDLSTVPPNAIVESWTIRFYLKQMEDASRQQFVQMYLSENKENAVIGKPVNQDDIDNGINMTIDVSDATEREHWLQNKNGQLSIQLKVNSENYKYYSTSTSSDQNDAKKQPKLIIKYYMPAMMAKANWSQQKSDPQHSGHSHWKSNASPTSMQAKEIVDFGNGFMMSKPAIYDHLLVFPYQDYQDPKYRIRAYNEWGKMIMENRDIKGVVNFQPVIDHSGRLYCVVANTTIKVLDLKNKLVNLTSKPLNTQVSATPTIGYDGSLYLPTDQGLIAYTPYPDLKVKWKYSKGNNHFGSVALSEDEKTVYVINGEEGKLIALDNTDASMKWEVEIVKSYHQEIPVPQVKEDRIITLDGIQKGERIIVVSDEGKIIKTINQVNPDELFSKPVLSSNYFYTIHTNSFFVHNVKDGEVKILHPLSHLNSANSMVVDGNDNIYVLDVEQDHHSITVFDSSCSLLIPTTSLSVDGNLADEHMMLSPSGNIITDSRNKLFIITPRSLTVPGLTIDQFHDQYIYRADNNITVQENVILPSSTNTIISAGKTISFKKGFRAKAGSKLRCKIRN